MLMLISPAKSLDFEQVAPVEHFTTPRLTENSHQLIKGLQKLTPNDIGQLMKISPALSDLNFERFQVWQPNFSLKESKQALFAFTGEVYRGIDASNFNKDQVEFAQDHLRILSGLYGLLRPLDLIRPYRLEMGTRFSVDEQTKNLYGYWGNTITDLVNSDLENSGSNVLLNIASNEYFKSVKKKFVHARIITPEFKDNKNGEYKTVMTWAKKARGLMVNYVIKHAITNCEDVKSFDTDGYMFNESLSTEDNWIFTRG